MHNVCVHNNIQYFSSYARMPYKSGNLHGVFHFNLWKVSCSAPVILISIASRRRHSHPRCMATTNVIVLNSYNEKISWYISFHYNLFYENEEFRLIHQIIRRLGSKDWCNRTTNPQFNVFGSFVKLIAWNQFCVNKQQAFPAALLNPYRSWHSTIPVSAVSDIDWCNLSSVANCYYFIIVIILSNTSENCVPSR